MIIFWLPLAIKEAKSAPQDPFILGLYSSIPYSIGAIGMVANAAHSDRYWERKWHLSFPSLVS